MDFSLGAEMTTARLIIEYITASSSRQLVNVFRGRMKLLSLFRAIGKIERETFSSQGFAINDETKIFDRAQRY